jgi:putative FmdB family regulatory protein
MPQLAAKNLPVQQERVNFKDGNVMPLYDFRCEACSHEFEYRMKYEELKHYGPECPACGSHFTKHVWLAGPSVDKAKDPFDLLDGPIPDSKPIRSYANDRRKGGKDTT